MAHRDTSGDKTSSDTPTSPSDANVPLQQRSPICSAGIDSRPRYLRYVCRPCSQRATDVNGRPVEFFNVDMSGGIEGRYRDSSEPYEDQTCYIDGIECRADEAHMGGIVIQPKETGH